MFDVAWGSGDFLAAGEVPMTEGDFQSAPTPAAWVSDDGSAWTSLPVPAGARQLCSVAATSLGFMIVGWTSDGPMIWRTEEGTKWFKAVLDGEREVPEAVPYLGGCTVTELVDGFLATVHAADQTLTWTSVDGMSWIPGPALDMIATPRQVAALGNTVLVAGYRDESRTIPVLMVGTIRR